mgnify:FL=1
MQFYLRTLIILLPFSLNGKSCNSWYYFIAFLSVLSTGVQPLNLVPRCNSKSHLTVSSKSLLNKQEISKLLNLILIFVTKYINIYFIYYSLIIPNSRYYIVSKKIPEVLAANHGTKLPPIICISTK